MRETIDRFLSTTDWRDWTRRPLASDASARRYERLTSLDHSVILMIDPHPSTSLRQFISISAVLHTANLRSPRIFHSDLDLGLAIIEDLGPNHFAQWLTTYPTEEGLLYNAAGACLGRISAIAPPDDLTVLTPALGSDMVGLFGEWFAPTADIGAIQEAVATALAQLPRTRPTLSLRDFHAENLIWRPSEEGTDRVGLLDFQDAFVAHPIYDLVSLLRDARRDVARETFEMMTENLDMRAFATVSVQRNLRILGIFARLVRQQRKEKYASLIPRVVGHLRQDLEHPDLYDLANLVRPHLP